MSKSNTDFSQTSMRVAAVAIAILLFAVSWVFNYVALINFGWYLMLLFPGILTGMLCGSWIGFITHEWDNL